MRYDRLEENIIDMIKEEQIKLGYEEEKVYLYYPLKSLQNFMGIQGGVEEALEALEGFKEYVKDRLGALTISQKEGRFCFVLPPQAGRFVHEQLDQEEFIVKFISLIGDHSCSLESLQALFAETSDHVGFRRVNHGEFDYLFWFEDGKPDSYIYCIADEGIHMTYHRFTKEDYEDFGL